MPHATPLITTIVAGLGLAFVFGALAVCLRVPPIVGYLVAGILVGPFTPGYVADQSLAPELAELGVILLMFGVGLHFSLGDLLSVKTIAVPGALAQIVVATLMGIGLSWLLGWPVGGGLVFGLALSVASTVVLLRAMQERRLLETERGRIAVGWLIVEDLVMVLTLVLLPPLGHILGGAPAAVGGHGAADAAAGIWAALGLTLAKVAVFIALMLIVGRRVIPWILHAVVHTGSRELFRLAVLAIALGVAYGASQLFGVSLALGAFFAGMVLSESPLSHRAAEESLPLRDAFAVLFFVSVGMMFDPTILIRDPLPVLATLAIIVIGKSAAALLIVVAFGNSLGTGLTIAASLAQIGEFSFILADLGLDLKLLPAAGRDYILAGAILSILINPLVFATGSAIARRFKVAAPAQARAAGIEGEDEDELGLPVPTTLSDHVVLIGYGRVGRLVGQSLRDAARPFLVIEDAETLVIELRGSGVEVIAGNAARDGILEAAAPERAGCLIVAVPNAFEAAHVIRKVRAVNPAARIIARAHHDEEVEHLISVGADEVIMGEREIAAGIVDWVRRLELA